MHQTFITTFYNLANNYHALIYTVVTNTNAIADSVEVSELLPKDLYPPKIENSAQQLKDLVYGKMTAIYGEHPPKLITDRVETELHDILSRGYDVIYMSAQKLVANSPSTAIWSAAEAASARRSWHISPASRRSTPSRRTMSARSASIRILIPARALAAARICRTRCARSAARSCARTALTSRLRPSSASAAIKCPIST